MAMSEAESALMYRPGPAWNEASHIAAMCPSVVSPF